MVEASGNIGRNVHGPLTWDLMKGRRGPCKKEVLAMVKSLSCRDVGSDCDFSVCAHSEKEILDKASEHARSAHNLSEISNEFHDKIRSAIRDVDHC